MERVATGVPDTSGFGAGFGAGAGDGDGDGAGDGAGWYDKEGPADTGPVTTSQGATNGNETD